MKYSTRIVSGLILILMSSLTMASVKPGDKAPDFQLKDSNGKSVQLSDYKGKTVVLEWTNYDCPFVKKHYESSNIPHLQKTYTPESVIWLSIFSSAPGKPGNYPGNALNKKAENMNSKATALLRDEDGKVGKAYGAKVTPQFVIIDDKGIVQYIGAIDSIPTTDMKDIIKAKNYVHRSLEAMKAKKPIKEPATQPYGCSVKY